MHGGKKVVYIKNKASGPSKKCDQEFKVVQQMGKFGVVLGYLRKEFTKG